MSYKSILTVLTEPARVALTIAAAARIARAEDGHLSVLVLGIDLSQIGYAYIGTGPLLLQIDYARADAEARALEAAARGALEAEGPGLRYSLETAVAQAGALTELVAGHARFADLVVLPKPYGGGRETEAETILGAALFQGSAPVMVVPEGGLGFSGLPRRIVLAWNQSNEAMVAARLALPFLKAADLVDIAVVDPASQSAERSDPGGMLCQMLVRHGVKAEVSVLALTLPRVSEVIARHALDRNASLVVMGAYGHSRFREAILGGATRNMLEQAKVAVFMAH